MPPLHRRRALAWTALNGLGGLGSLSAISSLAQIAPAQAGPNRSKVRIAVDEQNPPFMYANTGGQARGVYPVLLKGIFAELGLGLELVPLPWKRALRGLDQAEHGVGGLYANSERLAKFDYGEPLLVETVRVYVRRGGLRDLRGLQDLHGLRLGVLRGWTYGDEFDAARRDGRMRVEEVAMDRQNFGKLERGYLDAVLAVEQTGEAVMAGGEFPSVRALATPLMENPAYLAFHKSTGQQALLKRVDAAVARLRDSGAHAKLVSQGLRD